MGTVSDLGQLMRDMKPNLREGRYFIASIDESQLMSIVNYLNYLVNIFREDEGFSLVFSEEILEEMKSISKEEPAGPFAWITLDVYSDLMAVGFLARITEALAKEKISVNAFSAYHHDHLFVPYEKKDGTIRILNDLSQQ
jgi:hypothetical protein